jgi:hypothetical protein
MGAPGAIVSVGLASGFLVQPPHDPMTEAVRDQNARDMMDGRLVPGSVLQFWSDSEDYARMRSRRAPASDPSGHSPMFLRYEATSGGTPAFRIIDQFGKKTLCHIADDRIHWYGAQDIWLAADWDD